MASHNEPFDSPSSTIGRSRAPYYTSPLAVPTLGSGGSFSIACSADINASPKACLDIILEFGKYNRWNNFCRNITVTTRGTWRPPIPSEFSHLQSQVNLSPGAQFIMDLDMGCTGTGPTRPQPLEVTAIQLVSNDEGQFRGFRVAWKMLGAPYWLLHSERVQEFLMSEGGATDYRCWETFGGLIASVFRFGQSQTIRSKCPPPKVALVFGASGISGWAFVNEIVHDYPDKGVWSKVHALTYVHLTPEETLWPDDPKLNIVPDINLLTSSQDELETLMKSGIQGLEQVTHVYYLAYMADKDPAEEVRRTSAMFQRAITAVDHLCPALEFVVLQTGSKMYGCHLLRSRPPVYNAVPLSESLPRLPQPYYDKLFYHHLLDWIASYAADKRWSWCDTRPDVVVGFTPLPNFYSLASGLGIFLSLFREINGEGAECPFPGTSGSWVAKGSDSSSDMIAREAIYLSLHPSLKDHKGEAFNVADSRAPSSWSQKWPVLCAHFGLKGTQPPDQSTLEIRTYIKQHLGTWLDMEKKYGLKSGWADSPMVPVGFEYALLTLFDFDRQFDMTKLYGLGFTEERTISQSWAPVFDRMRAAKIIP